jgi:hypothetical protein
MITITESTPYKYYFIKSDLTLGQLNCNKGIIAISAIALEASTVSHSFQAVKTQSRQTQQHLI